jgi:hypothetical protein
MQIVERVDDAMRGNDGEDEVERRRKIAEEKMMGAFIELVEKIRKKPVARSIAFRLLFLSQAIYDFQQTVKAMGSSVDPITTPAPIFTKEQTNFLIKTYNSIIKDIHAHLAKKDSYVTEFSYFKELNKPTINEVAKTLFMMGTNILQILSYMLRWTE